MPLLSLDTAVQSCGPVTKGYHRCCSDLSHLHSIRAHLDPSPKYAAWARGFGPVLDL